MCVDGDNSYICTIYHGTCHGSVDVQISFKLKGAWEGETEGRRERGGEGEEEGEKERGADTRKES